MLLKLRIFTPVNFETVKQNFMICLSRSWLAISRLKHYKPTVYRLQFYYKQTSPQMPFGICSKKSFLKRNILENRLRVAAF